MYFKNILKTVSKEYKSTIAKAVKSYKNQRVEKLRNLKTSKPRDFWKIINSVDKRSDNLPPLDELHSFFFKKLNSTENEQTNEGINVELNSGDLHQINIELNQPISQNEVLQAIKNLKNNKSPGPDSVLNEHIKSTTTCFYQFIHNYLIRSSTQAFSLKVGH